ncbi:MAG: class I SAM-dependent methyltransferase [Promethearchaeota archaeon]
MISNINALQQINLNQKNIENLKVVLNREIMLEFLPKNGIAAEIGVDEGNFSKKIISLTNPKKLYLIDTWDSGINKMNFVKNRFQNEINAGMVVIKRGFSERELEKVENGYFDWVYIDTTHSYNQTLKELELCRLKVKDNGIIAGHDYCQGNINKALPYGVVQAVNQFCMKYNWEFIFLTHETDRKLSFAIRRIK